MTRRCSPRAAVRIGAVLGGLGLLCGCSSSGTKTAVATTTSSTPVRTTASSPLSTGTAGATTAVAQNVPVTDAVRQSLLEAGAALNKLPVSDYLGLAPGKTYYAYDSVTQTYWAGAALDPSPSSQQAQVAAQDDGSYLLFTRGANGTWTAQDDGLGGTGGTPCPAIPAAVVAVWNWAPGTCRPPGS